MTLHSHTCTDHAACDERRTRVYDMVANLLGVDQDGATVGRLDANGVGDAWDLPRQLQALDDSQRASELIPEARQVMAQCLADVGDLQARLMRQAPHASIGETLVWVSAQLAALSMLGATQPEVIIILGELGRALMPNPTDPTDTPDEPAAVQAIRARHAAASRGPWRQHGGAIIADHGADEETPVAYVAPPLSVQDPIQRDDLYAANTAFIAHAWGDIEALLELLNRANLALNYIGGR
ncbi:hypothetical protein [Actinomadura flavalba]|uniref:hypothetical protein n=1 Tax=Actinomadura flavalba TaxID=1120938 RepID=UPI000378535C|nr:hypothetical protein [Actinomadura flavalba]